MIFYTLKGPRFELEIHENKLRLHKKGWISKFRKNGGPEDWNMEGLSHFEITIPQYILWGKLEWQTFDGKKGSFRFSTNSDMVKKIEKYLQKVIIRNHQSVEVLTPDLKKAA